MGRGPAQGVIHAVDCGEVPAGAPPLTLDHALGAAENPGVRLCSRYGAASNSIPCHGGYGRSTGIALTGWRRHRVATVV
ncbi:DUF6233 domain-containing protein [Streptomyces rishiriensis]|uniref:DUF6233 domain-containing protein n=1 Tax=Streptomyces rishiriensis TaxID=68264 RepID=UPI00378D7167